MSLRNLLWRTGMILLVLASVSSIRAQVNNVGIGTASPHPSAIVHLADTLGKGFAIPHTDTNAVLAYANSFTPAKPIANGLLIFEKNARTFYYYDANAGHWEPLNGLRGPTGPRGATGPTGLTGPTGTSTVWEYGETGPLAPGDCDDFYMNVRSYRVFRFDCTLNNWVAVGSRMDNKIRGGYVSVKHSNEYHELSEFATSYETVKGLDDTVTVPFGYVGYVWVHSYGSAIKKNAHDDYNYAQFDYVIGNPLSLEVENRVTISMGPNGQAPGNHPDRVKWSLAYAGELASGSTNVIRTRVKQKTSRTGNGPIIVADSMGIGQAHQVVYVLFKRD